MKEADSMGNYNWKITTKLLTLEDIYPGIFVQAFGNSEHIYKLIFDDGHWSYKSIFRIEGVKLIPTPGSGSKYKIRRLEPRENGFLEWCETTWTRGLNPDTIREDKLKQIGL